VITVACAMAEILEAGHVYFFYRPRLEQERASGLHDVQRSYMVLHPRGKRVWRLIVIPRKRLPEVASHEREWAFVDTVGRSPEEVEDALDRQQYVTKTRGERVRPEAGPAGEGVYVLARHGDHTHLAYELEFPKRPGEVQRELRIQKKTELVLIGATEEPERELGIDLRARDERENEAAIFRDLKLERDRHRWSRSSVGSGGSPPRLATIGDTIDTIRNSPCQPDSPARGGSAR